MSETAYHLTVGEFKCIIFSDGCLADPGETFGLNCIYMEAGDRKILVDNGCGEAFQAGTAGQLLDNMESEGIGRGDIDTIIFDHGHIDHVCGTFNLKDEPVFPNARYIISQKEWDYIEAGPGDNETQNIFYAPARKYLVSLKDRFKLVADNHEILPGIKMVPSHGHTPGNAMVDITSGGERLLCIGDIIHSPKEFTEPEHCAAFDVNAAEAIKTRSGILSKAARDGTFVFATHFTFPGLGYIREKGGVLRWDAI
ncbi:MAG: hypothetical protein A2Y89_00710 [Chloroflexi bacterium RBG_13_51_18]|nr:MAG: hypothetical protein A2Y89_00710 [Chloroflexi bacterium RBG_13_51_18]